MMKLSLACGLALSALLAACSSAPTHSQLGTAAAPSAAVAPAAPAAPAATAAPAAGTAVATASTKIKLVCDDTNQTGSHMITRICLTPEQMEARRKAAQQAAQDAQLRNAQSRSQSASGGPPI